MSSQELTSLLLSFGSRAGLRFDVWFSIGRLKHEILDGPFVSPSLFILFLGRHWNISPPPLAQAAAGVGTVGIWDPF